MELSPRQMENAPRPMLVTLSGIWTEVRSCHWQKAQVPMVVTPVGILMEARSQHLENA